jgi:sulfur carrier protein ThiS
VVPNPKLSAAEQARLADTVAKLGLNQSAVALARKDCYD